MFTVKSISTSLNIEDLPKTEMHASHKTGRGILNNRNEELSNFSQFKNNEQCASEGGSVQISKCADGKEEKTVVAGFDGRLQMDSESRLETINFKQISADSSDKRNSLKNSISEEQVSFSNRSGIAISEIMNETGGKKINICMEDKGENTRSSQASVSCTKSTTENVSAPSTKGGSSCKGNNSSERTSTRLEFSTASGKQISVSEKSLAKVMKLFNEELNGCSTSSLISEVCVSLGKPFIVLENKPRLMETTHLLNKTVDKSVCEKLEQNVHKREVSGRSIEKPDVSQGGSFLKTGCDTKSFGFDNCFLVQEKNNEIDYKPVAERKMYLQSDSEIKSTPVEKSSDIELTGCNVRKSYKRKLISEDNASVNCSFKSPQNRINLESKPTNMNIVEGFGVRAHERSEKRAKISETGVKFGDGQYAILKNDNKSLCINAANSNNNNSTVKRKTEIELLGVKTSDLTSTQINEVSECTLALMELEDEVFMGDGEKYGSIDVTPVTKGMSMEQKSWGGQVCKQLKFEHKDLDLKREKILRAYLDAKKTQEEAIEMKKKVQLKPQPGNLFLSKEKEGRKQLRDLLGHNIVKRTRKELLTVGVGNDILDLTSLNAHEFKFVVQRFSDDAFEIRTNDGFILVPDLNNEVRLSEIRDCFLASPGVNPSLVPVNWVENHYRWIIWKLCSYERTFPKHFFGRCLNVENVLLQLKYRYDKEIDKSQRPALRKILEGAEKPGRTFVCCVASIRETNFFNDAEELELEITDGWYSVFTLVDSDMVQLVRKNIVKVGTKLIVHGAELLNCVDGCDALNVPKEVKLKIHTNSVRRVTWYSKLGFFKNPGPFVVSLNSVLPNGGLIGCTTGVIARVYPLLFMTKDSEGKTVFRNEQAQSIEETKQNEMNEKKVEAIYENTWKEVEKNYTTQCLKKEAVLNNIKNIDDPETLYAIYKMTDDESLFSANQLKAVTAHHEEVNMKIRNEVEETIKKELRDGHKNITQMIKVQIVDYFTGRAFRLTIWRPTEDILFLINECKTLDFYGLFASGVRDNTIQLSTGRQTRLVENNCLQSVSKYKRKITKLSEFKSDNFYPLFGEVDVIGVVIYVEKPDQIQSVVKVYLSDLKSNYLTIIFCAPLKNFGCEDVLKEGSLIAGSNLQWRTSRSLPVPCVYATEMSIFSQNPKQLYFKQEITEFNIFSMEKSLVEFAKDEKTKLLNSKIIRKHPDSTLQSTSSVHSNLSKLKSPSTPCQKRTRLLNQHAQGLSLSPISLANNHPNVNKQFISPFRTKK